MSLDFDIASRVAAVRRELTAAAIAAGRDPKEVKLLAATKQQPVYRISEAIAAGVDAVGENRVQEMREKMDAYSKTELHFIGTLQKNKVKHVVGTVKLIHSVDSVELAELAARCAQAQDIVQDILLEVNIADEESKGGFTTEDLEESLYEIAALPGLRLRGLMCIPPPPTADLGSEIFFSKMSKLYVDIKQKVVDNRNNLRAEDFSVLSMGMSGDYAEAVRYGSTLVRVGSSIFGPRNYNN